MENRKLIYQLSCLYNHGNMSDGTIYYKEPLLDSSRIANIWIKRAYKKGYVDLVGDNSSYWIYRINEAGIKLLKGYPNYYLQLPYNDYSNYIKSKSRRKR